LLEKKWVDILDHYRELRHDNQYNINFFATKIESESALKIANEFLERMRVLLKRKLGT